MKKGKLLKSNIKNTSNKLSSVRELFKKMNITDEDRKQAKQIAEELVESLRKVK